jgi:hypothetical protein
MIPFARNEPNPYIYRNVAVDRKVGASFTMIPEDGGTRLVKGMKSGREANKFQ